MLDASGLQRVGGAKAIAEWALLSLASAALVASFWSAEPLDPGPGLHASTRCSLSVAFGVAGVLGVMHAFGGPAGNLAAPTWALVALSFVAAVCVAGLLATAALIVEDVRAGEEEE